MTPPAVDGERKAPPGPWTRALVTGASSGIGRAFAEALAARGCNVILVARSEDRLRQLGDALATEHGVDTEVLVADLTDPEQLGTVEARLRDDDPGVDLLVNNAGFGSFGSFVKLPVEPEEAQVRLNVIAVVRLTHAALGPMLARERGTIINVASLGAFQPDPYFATYGATKSFVLSFSEAVAEEVRASPVTVSCLAPGFTRTGFQSNIDADPDQVPDRVWQTAEEVAQAGLDGAARGRPVVVPGALNRVTASISRVLPSTVSRRVAGELVRRRG